MKYIHAARILRRSLRLSLARWLVAWSSADPALLRGFLANAFNSPEIRSPFLSNSAQLHNMIY